MKTLPRLLLAIGLITIALRIPLAILLASTTVRAQDFGSQSAPVGLAVMQMSGRAFQEGLQAGDRDQARLFIWSLEGPDQSILGPDAPLFEPGCVAKFSEGVQCAYFPVVVNAIFAETFDTSTPDLVGHNAIRLASGETWRIFFDPAPDGTRSYENLASFEKGKPVAVYAAREFITSDVETNFVLARNNLTLISSTPFTLNGITIDFKKIAPRLMGVGHARLPEPDPSPQPIPTNEPPFGSKGPGFFVLHEPISGTFQAVQP